MEIIKREWVKNLESNHPDVLMGLHQYNEIGCLEELEAVGTHETSEEDRSAAIVNALTGKNQLVFLHI